MQRKRRQSFSHSIINNIEEFKYRSSLKDIINSKHQSFSLLLFWLDNDELRFIRCMNKGIIQKYLHTIICGFNNISIRVWGMSYFKDKIKSKLKSPLSQPETMESFDQNSVSVTFSQGKTQLSQIKLQCLWNNKTNMKIPKLKCIWYNRTENNLQQIVGVEDEIYQPSIIDVGSIIQITCIPQLQGISYEGMPIQLKTTLLTLAAETQNQASHLLNQGKAKFFVQVKEGKLKNKGISYGCDSLLKIEGFRLILCQMKFGQLNDDILKQMTVDQLYPQIVINRRSSRQITIKFNEEESCLMNFKNNQVRDTFCLLNKLIIAKISTSKTIQKPIQPTKQTKPQVIQAPIPNISLEKQQRRISQEISVIKEQIKVQNIHKQPVVAKLIQNPKQSAAELLQLTNLRQQLKMMEVANAKLIKQVELQKDKNYNLQNKISQTKERLQNASKNYFQLEKELNLAKAEIQVFKKSTQQQVNEDNSKDQELLYYKNQIKLISTQNAKISQKLSQTTAKYQQVMKEVQNYRKLFNSNGQDKSFNELSEELKNIKEMNKELKLRYQYSLSEKDKIEQDLKNSRNLIQQIEAQKKYIERKYESLSSQINSPSLNKSRISQERSSLGQHSSLANSYVFEEIPALDRQNSTNSVYSERIVAEIDNKEKQIFELKRKIKDLLEENAYLRSIINKQKKSSTSKSQLKLELFEAKKIAGRLSQALMEKDMSINNLKQINKQLNKKNSELQQLKSSL